MIKLCRSSLIAELFGLVGIAAVTAEPLCGCVVDWMGPWHALLAARVRVLAFHWQVQNTAVLSLVLR